ncbi:MAG: anti-sigma factor family protein, partial [Candidatus Rokuibacteriota bacterium]
MTCHDTREWLSAWLDGALTVEKRTDVDAHLAACVDCRQELERLRATVGLLQTIAPVRAPSGFVDRVLAATRPEPWYRRLVRRLFWPLPVKLPLEAAAAALVAVVAVYLYQQAPELQQAARPDVPLSTPAPPASP